MATLTIKDSNHTTSDPAEIVEFLDQFGIWYQRFEDLEQVPDGASDDAILAAYDAPIQAQMESGGYVTADVINIVPTIPNLDAMLAKFEKEHWHDEDEVRFIVKGSGLFHIHPEEGPVFSLEVIEGDMINVPRGTHHWFHMCPDKTVRAIRLFQSKEGWTPHYTGLETATEYEPLCFGPSYIPPSA